MRPTPTAASMLAALGATAWAQATTEVARRIIEKTSGALAACALLSNDEVVKMTGGVPIRSITLD
jgi:hypothetical protein